MKFSCCISFWMSGPSKIPALSLSILNPGNDWQIYLKHSPSLSRAFTNCLISPNVICRGGSIILPLGTRGPFIMLFSPALSVIRGSKSFLTHFWLYRDCPAYIRSTDVFYIQIAAQAENSPFSDRRRFSSYAGCILCTQEPVLLVHTSPSASPNDLMELKHIHLCCVTTHISNFSWNCQWIGAKSLPHNEQYLISLVKPLHHCKQ